MIKKLFNSKAKSNKAIDTREDVSLHFPSLYNAELSYTNKRMTSTAHHPVLRVEFDTFGTMIPDIADISYFHNTGTSFIATEVVEFGVFEDGGKGVFFMCGDDMCLENFEEAKGVLTKGGGRVLEEVKPIKRKTQKEQPPKNPQVNYIQTEQNGMNTYVIYKAPSKAHALEYLKDNTVKKQQYYLVVETPNGAYCRDRDGIYKE